MSNDIKLELELNMSVKRAWEFWTKNQALEEWLTVKADVDPRLGGMYELFWEPEKRNQNSTIGCKILAFVPLKLLAFEWKGPVPFANIMNTEPLPTWVSLNFESTSSDSIIVHFRHSGWGNSRQWSEAKMWQSNAWKIAFDELKKVSI